MPALRILQLSFVAIAVAACNELARNAPVEGAPAVFETGDVDAGSTCATCLARRCTAAQAMCLTNASCMDIVACRSASDAGLACACTVASDAGVRPERVHHAFTACNDEKVAACASECAALNRPPSTLTCERDAGDAGGAMGPDACIACAAANCTAQAAACGEGTECGSFLACSSPCGTASCAEDCGNRHPTGKVAASELAACTVSNCQNDCEL